MTSIRVNITKRAENDLTAIYDYIDQKLQSPQAAMKLFNRLAKEIQSWEVFPERYPIVPELLDLGLKVRCLVIKNYSIFYRLDNDVVTVIRILHHSNSLDTLIGQLEKICREVIR